jgi:manganese/zinc/iron transport system permease protein
LVALIKQTTRLKEDTALGLVLASFFAVGICLLTRIQKISTGSKGGLDAYLFGQAASLGKDDVILMTIITVLAVLLIVIFYKELLLTSFDVAFARAAGFPVTIIHYTLMLLLAFSVVIALQAVGVVLVSAMLITPAAAAYLLTDRMHVMLLLASVFGVAAGAAGAFFSFLSTNLPTGPLMVMGASLVFVLAFLFGPRHGVVSRWWRRQSRSAQIQRENTLKAVYHVLEARDFEGEGVSLRELAEKRRETIDEVRGQSKQLNTHQMATLHEDGDSIHLTPEGWQRACEIVRNHRLWELYLTNEASIAPDHVHDDAEVIEHVLGEETVRQLERTLNHATKDPHGRPIPGLMDLKLGGQIMGGPATVPGYGRST